MPKPQPGQLCALLVEGAIEEDRVQVRVSLPEKRRVTARPTQARRYAWALSNAQGGFHGGTIHPGAPASAAVPETGSRSRQQSPQKRQNAETRATEGQAL